MSVAKKREKVNRLTGMAVEFSGKNMTPFGGMAAFIEFTKRIKLEELLSKTVEMERRKCTYSVGNMILAMVYSLVLGLERIADSILLRTDNVFLRMLGWKTFPWQSTINRFLRSFSASIAKKIGAVNVTLLEQVRNGWEGYDEITLDIDSHVRTVYGHQQQARKGYNPKKHGRKSYHPLLSFIGETRDFLCGRFRPGNTTNTGAVSFLRESLDLLKPERFQRVKFRADSGFFYDEFLDELENISNLRYAIAVKLYPHIQSQLVGLEYTPIPGGVEVADFKLTAWGGKKTRRIVVIREEIIEGKESCGKQLKLFELKGYAYRAIVTNDSALTAEEVWQWYNGRTCIENMIKEGICLGLDVNASHIYGGNVAHFLTAMLGYNLLNWFKEIGLHQKEEKKMGKWIRQRILNIPARLIKTGGQWILKMAADWPWRELFETASFRIKEFQLVRS
jgi:hypothetical protein